MDFLNHRDGSMVFYQVFILNSRNCKRLREFEEMEISRLSCRWDCEQQGGKLLRLLSGFLPRIRSQDYTTQPSWCAIQLNLASPYPYLAHTAVRTLLSYLATQPTQLCLTLTQHHQMLLSIPHPAQPRLTHAPLINHLSLIQKHSISNHFMDL